MNITKDSKSIIYLILAILIIIALGYGLKKYTDRNKIGTNLSLKEINQLTDEQKQKALANKVKDLENQAAGLTQDATSSVKYNIYIRLAEAKLEQGKYVDAQKALDSIPDEKKDNSRIFLDYGLAYKGQGVTDKAKEYIQKALNLDDTDPKTWLAQLDLNSDLLNDQLKAIYLQAIAATKSNLEIMVSYAHFAEKIGNKATAIAVWETARNGDPGNAAKYEAEIARLKQ